MAPSPKAVHKRGRMESVLVGIYSEVGALYLPMAPTRRKKLPCVRSLWVVLRLRTFFGVTATSASTGASYIWMDGEIGRSRDNTCRGNLTALGKTNWCDLRSWPLISKAWQGELLNWQVGHGKCQVRVRWQYRYWH